MLEPAVRQEELPAVEPEVLAELVERHEPEVLETSGPGPLLLLSRRVLLRPLLVLLGRPVLLLLLVLLGRLEARTGVAAGSNWSDLPLLILHLQYLRSVLSALSTRWLKSSKQRLSSAYWM